MTSTQENSQLDPRRRRVLILANPRAGSESSRKAVEDLVTALQGRGLQPTLCWQREELAALLGAQPPEDLRCIVAAGGDGTLLEVLNQAPGIPAALLPLGNENLVARHCGIDRSGRKLAEIIACGHCRRFDLARVNGRLFCSMASTGFDADVVHRVHRRRRGHINRFSYVVPTVQALRSYSYPLVEVEIEDSGERLRGAMVFVFNLPRYGPGLRVAPQARPDDGWLDLCVFERPGALPLLRYLVAVVGHRQEHLPDFQHRQFRRVRLWSSQPVPVQTDGDPAGTLPVGIEVVPGALTLLVAGERA